MVRCALVAMIGAAGCGRIDFAALSPSGPLDAGRPDTSSPVPDSSLSVGLVGYWKLDDGQGLGATDSSGYGNTGVLVNGPVWTSSVPTTPGPTFGDTSALSFDGVDDHVDVGNPAQLRLTGSMTLAAWTYETADPIDDGDIISKNSCACPGAYGFDLKSTPDVGPRTFAIELGVSASVNVQRHSATVRALNTWYHVAGVYDAAAQTLDIYVNGVLDNGMLAGTVPSAQWDPTAPVRIGDRPAGIYPLAGSIDDVRIYDRALSAAEVLSLYNGDE